jgi:hypothetical protein
LAAFEKCKKEEEGQDLVIGMLSEGGQPSLWALRAGYATAARFFPQRSDTVLVANL